MASIAEAIVFAVYIPPQAPAPGQAFLTISWRCSSVSKLLVKAPARANEMSASRAAHTFFTGMRSP